MSSTPTEPLGFLLTGGRGHRLGGCQKSQLTYRGRSFRDRLSDILLEAGCSEVVCSVAAKAVATSHDWPDPLEDLGPLGGWYGASRRRLNRPLVSVPVDMPALEAGDIRALIAAPVSGWIRAGERDHWVLARLDPADQQAVEAFVNDGGRSAAKFWTTRPDSRAVTLDRAPRFININTPADLSALDGV